MPHPSPSRTVHRVLACLLGAALFAPLTALTDASPAAADTPPFAAAQFQGVNWARPGDNYVDGPVVLEGLNVTDSYATVKAKADAVYNGLKATLGANTVRLPVNTKSVGTAWWNAYTGAIDSATAKGFKVVLSYWEDGASSNGRIVDMAACNAMWNTVVAKYGSNGLVYFEPMNEPHGYDATEWTNVAATWLADRPSVPRGRIFISGVGYNGDVKPVCGDSRLDGTYLSYHHYAFMSAAKTYDQWVAHFKDGIGPCASRTVLDEFGAPMDDGLNYNTTTSTDNFIRYLRADTDTVRALGVGAVYWPALGGPHNERPTYDYYSLFALQGSGTNLSLGVRNISGIDRLKYAWGLDPGAHTGALHSLSGTNRCLDVPGATHTNSTQVMAWTCNGGDNQKWTRTPSGQLTVYNGEKCLDVGGQATANGSAVGIYDCNGGANQKWTFSSDGTIRGVQSGRCLDLDQTTAQGQLYDCWAGDNQKWQTL
ncbi:cellulase family glycosylhydrolase [Streptomyces sp. So13.3]|uniref:ricin-type beta-trefoil lectin domain protein n=1 Tax=Streptomyces TaxID=1883 RepID=UPI0011058C77|nr:MULTISPECIES: ricin-type beta-trefoil lectin domain protein [Streptomyces]MCZ4102077.1 ricin-type beta-trefoil lectin domain protein [Streptomyces sp. H39-C1]QNA77530.1 cellulase family glycosylhydrolase [Streptomyces sp. So13.3]